MLFPTIRFAIFFMVVLPTSWLLIRQRLRWQLFILAASYFFYGYYDWRFAFLLAGSTVATGSSAARSTAANRTPRAASG
jgi:alginate O-acetyltransferase complex protein AlgI